MIEFKNVEKVYPTGFKFGPFEKSVEQNSTIALLGVNGAGKSTLFKLLTGSIDATGGSIEINRSRVSPTNIELKRKFGYLPQKFHLPSWLSAIDILTYAQSFYSDSEVNIEEMLNYWDCNSYKNKPMDSLSHGMKKRVGLAVATMHEPEILILDEPFSGLDVYHIKALKDKIRERSKKNKMTFLCTHIAPYAAELCTEAWHVNNGQITEFQNWKSMSSEQRCSEFERSILERN